MSIGDQIKGKIISEGWSIKEIANELESRYKKKYTSQNLSNKLRRKTIRYSEVLDIADIIGYELKWVEKKRPPC